jgi:hypothetical protein
VGVEVGVTGVGVWVIVAVDDGVAAGLRDGEGVADGEVATAVADGREVPFVAIVVAVTKRTATVGEGAIETSPQPVASRATISTIALIFDE